MFPRQSPAERDALAWLQRRHGGPWTAADESALQAWLSADSDHPSAWADAQKLWSDLGDVRGMAQADLRRARQRRPADRPWRAAVWPAGAVALAAMAVLAWRSVPGAFDEPRLVQTARGQMQTLLLTDGSRIELNTDTRIKITPNLFCRCVELLNGEALFTVAHGDLRPFRVAAGTATLVDVGTVFWLRRDTASLGVAVSEGLVDVFIRGEQQAHRLAAGEALALDGSGRSMPAPARNMAELTAWRQGQLVFHDAPLADVLQEFARYHPVRFEIDARLSGYRLSGRLASADLEKLLALLQAGYPAQAIRVAPDLIRVSFRSS
jgi:transmembrane sensor